MNVIELILREMQDDDEPSEKQAHQLQRLYEEVGEKERAAIDAALVCVCGWTLPTLVRKARASPAGA